MFVAVLSKRWGEAQVKEAGIRGRKGLIIIVTQPHIIIARALLKSSCIEFF